MTNESILISEVIPATPQRIFSAWMDSAEHSAFTGDEAMVVPEVGGEHRAAGGYIQGRTLELNEGSRIVQSWRTTEFPPESPDSRVEITLEPTLGGTLVTLLHTDIPVGQGDRYRQSWNEYYLSRLKSYFSDTDGAVEAAGTNGVSVDVDLEEETSVGDLEPTTVVEAPTKIMKPKVKRALTAASRGGPSGSSGSTGDTQTVRVAAKAAAPRARARKQTAKPVAKAKARRRAKPVVKAAARRPVKKPAAKVARKATKKPIKLARRLAGKLVRKPARKSAKKLAAKSPAKSAAKKVGGAKAKRPAAKKKAGSSARSRR